MPPLVTCTHHGDTGHHSNVTPERDLPPDRGQSDLGVCDSAHLPAPLPSRSPRTDCVGEDLGDIGCVSLPSHPIERNCATPSDKPLTRDYTGAAVVLPVTDTEAHVLCFRRAHEERHRHEGESQAAERIRPGTGPGWRIPSVGVRGDVLEQTSMDASAHPRASGSSTSRAAALLSSLPQTRNDVAVTGSRPAVSATMSTMWASRAPPQDHGRYRRRRRSLVAATRVWCVAPAPRGTPPSAPTRSGLARPWRPATRRRRDDRRRRRRAAAKSDILVPDIRSTSAG